MFVIVIRKKGYVDAQSFKDRYIDISKHVFRNMIIRIHSFIMFYFKLKQTDSCPNTVASNKVAMLRRCARQVRFGSKKLTTPVTSHHVSLSTDLT